MRSSRGQAGLEALCALPLLVLVGVLGLQALVWAAVAIEASSAAGRGARAELRGDDALSAARAALPRVLWPGLAVAATDGRVEVGVMAPALVPGIPPIRLRGHG
jgi:hypothetical protein